MRKIEQIINFLEDHPSLADTLQIITMLLLLILASSGSGCAYMRSTTTRTPIPNTFSNYGTNQTGVAIYPFAEKTTVRVYTLFDGNAALAKFRNGSGYATNGVYGPGTYVGSINESSSASNLVQIISAVAQGVVNGLKP